MVPTFAVVLPAVPHVLIWNASPLRVPSLSRRWPNTSLSLPAARRLPTKITKNSSATEL